MKRISKLLIFSAAFMSLLILCAPVSVCAEEPQNENYTSEIRCTILENEGTYSLSVENDPNSSKVSESLKALLEFLPDGAFVDFGGVICRENITLTDKNITLSGSLSFAEAYSLIIDGENISLEGVDFRFSKGSIKIKSGRLTLTSGTITSEKTVLSIDQTDSCVFEMKGGKLSSLSDTPAFILDRGTAYLEGGEISSLGEYAVSNKATLFLSRSFTLSAKRYSIYTQRAISLLPGEVKTALLIKYGGTFENGTLTEILIDTARTDLAFVRIYDENYVEFEPRFFESSDFCDEKNFIAVFNSFKLQFKDTTGTELFVLESVYGEYITPPIPDVRNGYEFSGWYLDEGLTNRCYFDSYITADTVFYASYKLVHPEFRISSSSFVYDARHHNFGLDFVSHPLEDEGVYSYEWYKNGEYFSSGEHITLVFASDSGEYSCKITFTHGTSSVSVTTMPVSFTIEKAEVTAPYIEPKIYSGALLSPSIIPSSIYTNEKISVKNVGVYSVSFTLTDTSNYKWSTTDEQSVSVIFEILKAENSFVKELSVFDVYFLNERTFSASALFGEVLIAFYESDGISLIEGIPSTPGEYYASAYVEETTNYTSLFSPLLKFTVLNEAAVGISVLSGPDISDYVAFDIFDPRGLSVLVSYNSGRLEAVHYDELDFFYQTADSLRFGDSAVKAVYKNTFVFVPVTVKKADYDITDVVFNDSVSEYNGAYITANFTGTLPVGRDGIPLCADVKGGGIDEGSYNVYLVFKSASINYNIPEQICAKLTILPKKIMLSWDKTDFIYNGEKQCPRASFADVFGIVKEATTIGGEYSAGDSYIVFAEKHLNYIFENPSVSFRIQKADYDMSAVAWTTGDFLYSGTIFSVGITGLPNGVAVGGYANNTAQNAGKYKAEVSLIFDSENYNKPIVDPFVWNILPAEYDLTQFSFEDSEIIFNGDTHYPKLLGQMPVGVDGSCLEYRFSRGAAHVTEGVVNVEISFYTSSGNYTVPSTITRTVTVKPAPVTVAWDDLCFTYDSKEHKPRALADECSVSVNGFGTDAGEYIAVAVSDDQDYCISNPEIKFVILKAENYFVEKPYAKDIFEGGAANVGATPYFGDGIFLFYTDAELSCKTDDITAPGIYYMVVYVPESKNFLPLYSENIPFSVIKIVPIGMDADLKIFDFCAFETVNPDDFEAALLYNNGEKQIIPSEDVFVFYENGESLRFGDTRLILSYDDFSCELSVNVRRAVYDLSSVVWSNLRHSYDGEEKRALILGLPESIKLIRVEGGAGINAGEYTARAIFEYDAENYEKPEIPDGMLIIERAIVPIPALSSSVYNSKPLHPKESSALWTYIPREEVKNAGEYVFSVKLTDEENYIFENGQTTASSIFKIEPSTVSITIPDIKLYLFDKYEHPDIEISGDIADGDSLGISYVVSEDKVSVISSNPNYNLVVDDGKIIRSYLPSPRIRGIIFLILLCIFLLILIIVVLSRKKYQIIAVLSGRSDGGGAELKKKSVKENKEAAEKSEDKIDENIELQAFASPMDPQRADSLISNSLAKELIGTEGECIFTNGKRRSIVNIDTLSENFSSGDRVDVNILKSKSLVPYDTGYIKVLARGVIDKPLYVYANDFSHTSVKMLALTGGKAYKITTVRTKGVESEE